jgi:hypothetical protein
MPSISVRRGLFAGKTVYNFTGRLRDNLNLNWERREIFKGAEDLSPDYEVKEGDVVPIQEHPAGTGGLIITSVVVAAAISCSNRLEKKMRADMEAALDGTKNQQSGSSLPYVAGARNQMVEPPILGRTLPYASIGGDDGEDLYWRGAFLSAPQREADRQPPSSQKIEFTKEWEGKSNDHGKVLVFQSAKHPLRLEIQFDMDGLSSPITPKAKRRPTPWTCTWGIPSTARVTRG